MDFGISISDKFALHGLPHLCQFLNARDFGNVRLVCQSWARCANKYFEGQNIKKYRGLFQENWKSQVESQCISKCLKWDEVKMSHFQFRDNMKDLTNYWNKTCQFVTHLQIYRCTIKCTDLINFLNICIPLKHLKLTFIHFYNKHIKSEKTPQNRLGYIRVYCREPEHVVQSVPEPNIEFLELQGQFFIPPCLIAYLRLRCQGKLVEFGITHRAFRVPNHTVQIPRAFPNETSQLQAVRDLLADNAQTMRTLNLYRSTHIENLLTMFNNNHVQLLLNKFRYGQDVGWNIAFRNEAKLEQGFNFIANQVNHLQELEITVNARGNFAVQFNDLLAQLRVLKKLSIFYNYTRDKMTITGIRNMRTLRCLSITDYTGMNFEASLTTATMNHLPFNLEHLHLGIRRIKMTAYRELILSENFKTITKINFAQGQLFGNPELQLLLEIKDNLKELHIGSSYGLSDSGITGIPKEFCQSLNETQSYVFFKFSDLEDLEISNRGRNISNFAKLKKLTIGNCKYVTDVSIIFGISFPELEELDLSACKGITDFGVYNAALNNPKLKVLSLLDNPLVSVFGLSTVIKANPTIKEIHVSQIHMKRDFTNVKYEKSPDLDYIVKIAPKDKTDKYRHVHKFVPFY